jgi:hypothetical protein
MALGRRDKHSQRPRPQDQTLLVLAGSKSNLAAMQTPWRTG